MTLFMRCSIKNLRKKYPLFTWEAQRENGIAWVYYGVSPDGRIVKVWNEPIWARDMSDEYYLGGYTVMIHDFQSGKNILSLSNLPTERAVV